MQYIKTKILASLLITFFCAGSLYSQDEDFTIRIDTIRIPKTKRITIVTVRTPPKFILQFTGGMNMGAMETTNSNGIFSRRDAIEGKNFGVRYGFGFGLTGKLPLGKKANFWLDATAGYDKFNSEMFSDSTRDGDILYNSINWGFGTEYNFTPTHKVKYYMGLTLLFSHISGESHLINTQENNVLDVNFKSSFRMGYNAYLGFDYSVGKDVGITALLKFTHANLLLKNSDPGEQLATGSTLYETQINDYPTPEDADPVLFAGWKQFAYFSARVGISYFFGVKQIRYRIPDGK
jgi:hypothetical protein